MKPRIKIAETKTPDGNDLVLFEHDGSYAIRMNGQGLMDSRMSESERMLGEIGTAGITGRTDARVLIGGLGLGFTLKSVLQNVASTAKVHVAELLAPVMDWNREYLRNLNGALLDDPRVIVHTADVFRMIQRPGNDGYDAILLDIDNGPSAMVQDENARLYTEAGLQKLAAALRPGGRAVIWSAGDDPAFQARLIKARLKVEVVRARRYPGARKTAIFLYVADKR